MVIYYYLKSCLIEMSWSASFFITFATDISKSSCVTFGDDKLFFEKIHKYDQKTWFRMLFTYLKTIFHFFEIILQREHGAHAEQTYRPLCIQPSTRHLTRHAFATQFSSNRYHASNSFSCYGYAKYVRAPLHLGWGIRSYDQFDLAHIFGRYNVECFKTKFISIIWTMIYCVNSVNFELNRFNLSNQGATKRHPKYRYDSCT